MFEQFFTTVLGIFVPEFQVSAALAGFTRVAKKLDAAAERMHKHIARSYSRTDKAFDAYHRVARVESKRRVELTTAIGQARTASQKIREITG